MAQDLNSICEVVFLCFAASFVWNCACLSRTNEFTTCVEINCFQVLKKERSEFKLQLEDTQQQLLECVSCVQHLEFF